MPTFKLTRGPLEELRYKLSILRDEPDLLDDYGVTEEHAEEFLQRMMFQKPGMIEVSDVEAAIISGELEKNSPDFLVGWQIKILWLKMNGSGNRA